MKRHPILQRPWFTLLVSAGVATRLAFVVMAGNRLLTPFSGGGDTREYVLLARNLLEGRGFSYAGMATAFRPPLYPLLLAGLMWASPRYWVALLHGLQFFFGLTTAWLCGRLAERWFGPSARNMALLLALFLPTLVYFTGETLTETTAGLLGILYLLYLDRALRVGDTRAQVLLGVVAGVAALVRFNAAELAPVAIGAVLFWPPSKPARAATDLGRILKRWIPPLVVAASCGVVVAPWLIRTAVVFDGRALYSTHGGFAAVEGVLMPLGRTQPGETPTIENTLGWGNWEVESNDPKRVALGPEPDLNNQAWQVAFNLWRERSWHLAPITAQKISAFWLSTDQIFQTASLSQRNRSIRWVGVVAYWVTLALGVFGWFRLRGLRPSVAKSLLLFAVVVTLLHLPLTMNTRLRSSLFDPLLASLAGGCYLSLNARLDRLRHAS